VRLVFSHAAGADLAAHVRHIAGDDPRAAQTVRRTIEAAAARLTAFPWSGRVGHRDGARELVVSAAPSLIVYEVGDDTVTILAILHGARDIPRVLGARQSDEDT
jgi:toxin ParE1/3/4